VRQSKLWRGLWAAVGLAFPLCFAGCGDKVQVTSVQPFVNHPPTIVAQGPVWDSTPIDVAHSGFPAPYIIVGDANGISDIAEAFFDVDTAIVHRIIARPDSISPPFCSFVTYNPLDTVDIIRLIQPTFVGVLKNGLMSRGSGTFFAVQPFFINPEGFGESSVSAFPPLAAASSSFGPALVGCVSDNRDALMTFTVNPPAAPSPTEISITYVDVEYRGLRATIYDASGTKATALWPPLRLIYTTDRERAALP